MDHVTLIHRNRLEFDNVYFVQCDFSKSHEYNEDKFFSLYLFLFTLCHIGINLYKKRKSSTIEKIYIFGLSYKRK